MATSCLSQLESRVCHFDFFVTHVTSHVCVFRKEIRAESLRKRRWKTSDHLPAAACQVQKEFTGSNGLCGPRGTTFPSRVHTGNTTRRTMLGGDPRSNSRHANEGQCPSRQWTTNSSHTASAPQRIPSGFTKRGSRFSPFSKRYRFIRNKSAMDNCLCCSIPH